MPKLFWREGISQREILTTIFRKARVQGDVSFVYSIFEASGDGYTTLVFKGDSTGDMLPPGEHDEWEVKVFHEQDMPWDVVTGDYTIGMVRRYFKEREADAFGTYCDTADGGRIAGIVSKPVNWMDWQTQAK